MHKLTSISPDTVGLTLRITVPIRAFSNISYKRNYPSLVTINGVNTVSKIYLKMLLTNYTTNIIPECPKGQSSICTYKVFK